MKQKGSTWYTKVLRYGIGAILVVAPFYLTISIWFYHFIGHLDFLKIWEEIALAAIGFVVLGFLISHRKFTSQLARYRLFILIAVYILFVLAVGFFDLITNRVSRNAVIYGWLTDLRPTAIFLVGLLTFAISQTNGLKEFPWRKVLIIPAVVVILFGFLQATVLPKDFLSHLGYSQSTTLPYQTVDNQPNLVRVESTLRGPNPFGAYIMIIVIFLLGWLLIEKRPKYRLAILAFIFISLFVMYNTYSRSAELGVVVSTIVLLLLKLKGQYLRRHLAAISIIVIGLAALTAIAVAHHNYLAQNVVLHTSNQSTSAVSSNAQRASAEKQGVKDIIHHPLGTGVGSAGPASRRNTKGPIRIAENFYLQIGQELGLIGLVLFTAINVFLGYELWKMRSSELSSSLLAALVGLTIASLFYHAWADETLAYIWWGLAAVALAPVILTDRHKLKNGQKIKTTP